MSNVSRRSVLFGVAILVFASADVVLAGGHGGSKSHPTIRVCNNTGVAVAVLADATAWINAGANDAVFLTSGGKILNPGQCHTFKVRAGTVQVFAIALDEFGDPIIGTETVIVVQADQKTKATRNVVVINGDLVIQ